MSVYRFAILFPIVSLLMAFTSCEKPERLQLGDMTFGWNSSYDSTTNVITFNDKWVGHGWWYGDDGQKGTSADFSDYDRVVVEIDSISDGITKIGMSIQYTNTDVSTWVVSPVVDKKMTLRADLDEENKSHIREIYIQSSRVGSVRIADAYLAHKVRYAEPKQLEVVNGFISAEQFDGFSDDAIVEFNYRAEGELTALDDNGKIMSMDNWSIGIVCSLADIMEAEIPCRYIPVSSVGDVSYRCFMSDIRYMLNLKDDEGLSGLYWNIWRMGNITEAYPVSAEIREVKARP